MLDLHCHILQRIDDVENDLEDFSAISSVLLLKELLIF